MQRGHCSWDAHGRALKYSVGDCHATAAQCFQRYLRQFVYASHGDGRGGVPACFPVAAVATTTVVVFTLQSSRSVAISTHPHNLKYCSSNPPTRWHLFLSGPVEMVH